ncbi:MAG TPA: hypothetical protein VIH76_19455 [Candidatus Acidoferrales bacterium]
MTNQASDRSPALAIPESGIPADNQKWFLWFLILAAGGIRCVFAIHSAANGLFDDAYVSLRYASNLVRGLGFVFNPGERVLGTTSPLNAFLLAAIAKFVGVNHLEGISVTIGTLASLGSLYYSERLIARAGITGEVKWTYLCVLAFLPSFIVNAASGMETPLVLLLMSLSIYFAVQDRLVAVAVVGILLFLSRIDTGIWLVALGGNLLLERRGRPQRRLAIPLVIFLGGVLSWLAFSQFYFGSIIPQSVIGKALHHGAFERADWHYSLTFLSAFIPAQRFGVWGFAVIAIAMAALIPGTLDLWNRHRDLRPMIVFVPLFVAAFLASRAPLFSWYVIPPKWAFYLVAVYSIWWWVAHGLQVFHFRFRPAAAMTLISLCVIGLALHSVKKLFEGAPFEPWPSISDLIEQDLRSDGRIFLEHIGLIGFRTGRYIYDYGGLVTPQTTKLKREYGRNWLTKALRQDKADVVILYDTDMPSVQSATDSDAIWFRDSYNHVKDYKTDELVASVFFLKSSPRIIADQPERARENLPNSN